MRKFVTGALTALVLGWGFAATTPASAAGDAIALPQQDWSFDGLFGTYDRNALRRGLMVYRQVCSSCHSLNLVAYRNLLDVGYSEDEIKAIAADVEVEDGPNDDGDMYQRPGRPSDHFVSPFPNEQAARASNNGALPPDLSLMTKARKDGPNYVHALLTGYVEPPADFKVMDGMHYNAYFPGHQIAMPPPLSEGAVDYPDGVDASVEQMSSDVSTFLAWTAEPKMENRKRLGIKVLLFLIVLTGMLYAVKRQIWSNLH